MYIMVQHTSGIYFYNFIRQFVPNIFFYHNHYFCALGNALIKLLVYKVFGILHFIFLKNIWYSMLFFKTIYHKTLEMLLVKNRFFV